MIDFPEIFRLIENASLFRGVPRDVLEPLFRNAKLISLKPGEKLLARGTINEHVYVLISGYLSVQATPSHLDQPLATLTPGECVGEMSVLVDSLVSADVIASTDCQLFAIDYSAFWSLISTSNEATRNMFDILVRRIRLGNESMTENIHHHESTGGEALFDSLTGLYNRQGMHEKFDRLLHRCVADNKPVSLVVLEIDELPQPENDRSELRGDQALRTIAQTMLTFLRPDDYAARLTGKKFAVLLSDTSLADASVAAERLRKLIGQSRITLPNGSTLPSFTISAGVSEAMPEDSWNILVARAEMALDQAVEAGRNQIASA